MSTKIYVDQLLADLLAQGFLLPLRDLFRFFKAIIPAMAGCSADEKTKNSRQPHSAQPVVT